MKVVIDKFGRIVVPKTVREKLGVGPLSKLDLREENGRVWLEPLGGKPQLERNKEGILVLTGRSQDRRSNAS